MTDPVNLDALAPVALWKCPDAEAYCPVECFSHEDEEGRWLPAATYAALVSELRAAREALALLKRAAVAWDKDSALRIEIEATLSRAATGPSNG
jgi:hypothetical protein